jgi:SAM-dependent methyltransferase
MPIAARGPLPPPRTTTTATARISRTSRLPSQYLYRAGLRTPPTPTTMAAASSPKDAEPGSRAPPIGADWNEYHARWENIWRDGCAPGQFFDKASASPTLRSLLSLPLLPAQVEHLAAQGGLPKDGSYVAPPSIDARNKRALVPGCGRGYDVVAFAQAGASAAVGLELSPKAAEVAREYVRGELAGRGVPSPAANAQIVECDFFSPPADTVPPESFDLGYDLTFLCALHPSMREAWAAGWSRLLKKGALLVTACYPIDASRDQNAGPPWPLTPQLYERLLLGEGGPKFRKVYLAPVPPAMSHPERAGQEWLGIWERL